MGKEVMVLELVKLLEEVWEWPRLNLIVPIQVLQVEVLSILQTKCHEGMLTDLLVIQEGPVYDILVQEHWSIITSTGS